MPCAEVAGERGQPAAAEQAAGVAHRVLAAHAGPIGQRRPGDDDRAEQLRPQRREHHDRPAGLAIADHAGLAVGLGMQRDDLLEEHRLGARDVLDGLAGHGLGQEADEVAGMAGLEGDADLAVGLEAADARAVPGARIDDDERPAPRIDRRRPSGGTIRAKHVVDRPLERAAVDQRVRPHSRARAARSRRDARDIGCRAGASRPRTGRCAARRRPCIPSPRQTEQKLLLSPACQVDLVSTSSSSPLQILCVPRVMKAEFGGQVGGDPLEASTNRE